MTDQSFLQCLKEERLIATVKREKQIEKAAASDASIVFLLSGSIGVMKGYVDFLKSHHKQVFLHLEKIGGLSSDREGLDYIANFMKPTGIITTRASTIKLAKKKKLIAIQRLFVIDTDSVSRGIESLNETEPDAVEVMPARIPEIISHIKSKVNVPLISGGLLENREQINQALSHGAMAVSTGNPELWKEYIKK